VPAEAWPLIHPNLAAIYRQKVTDLHAALQRDGSRDEAAEILRDLIEEITLAPENGALRLDLRGCVRRHSALGIRQQKARL
jgi:hypothetical protein